jgi:hypothetical protein
MLGDWLRSALGVRLLRRLCSSSMLGRLDHVANYGVDGSGLIEASGLNGPAVGARNLAACGQGMERCMTDGVGFTHRHREGS